MKVMIDLLEKTVGISKKLVVIMKNLKSSEQIKAKVIEINNCR